MVVTHRGRRRRGRSIAQRRSRHRRHQRGRGVTERRHHRGCRRRVGRPHEGLHGRHLAGVVLRHGVGGGGRGEVTRAHGGVHGAEPRVERLEEVMHAGPALLRLGGQFSVPRLNPVLLHRDGALNLRQCKRCC